MTLRTQAWWAGLAVTLSVAVPVRAWADACLAEPVDIPNQLVTSTFGKTRLLKQYAAPRVHWGVDFHARDLSGKPAQLKAVDNGTVIGAGWWGHGYGNRVALRRANGDVVIYNHMSTVDPKLKGGSLVGFQTGGAAVGATQVSAGDILGVAGGMGDHMDRPDLPVHLHLEYVTGYGGVKLRETNDGTDKTRSRYLRNALEYSCKTYPFASDAGPVTNGTGGAAPSPSETGGAAAANSTVPVSADQIYEAQQTQPSVTAKERYGFPDQPPYATYDGMSEAQITDAEVTRRLMDTEWEVKLTGWSSRGILAEIARMHGVKLWLDAKIAEKKRRIEAMQAMALALQANRDMQPAVNAAYQQVVSGAARGMVGH
ncbi:M23 family metallopeptidase [Trinickia terrae]|uniref:M23 family metallopeptidase n=1 Tax=Trinickia terrae TaxID=2571161 RepID=A0A4U1I9L5_9BURK|nr:M23 family metallopeptidase [Trinickia terrae]TKC90172.1 M23 family metallopeptidase [Trinickia terrae]